MSRTRLISSAAALVLLVGGAAWLVSRDYTVLEVNGAAVSLSRFTKNYRAAARFRANAIEAYRRDPSGSTKAPEPLDERALKAAVLTQLVDAVLVEQGARAMAGSDLDRLVAERVDRYRKDTDLAEAARGLYGVSAQDFTEEVLVPQAMSEILRGRLFIENKSFTDWIEETRRAAKVTVFSDDFTWDGTRIAAR